MCYIGIGTEAIEVGDGCKSLDLACLLLMLGLVSLMSQRLQTGIAMHVTIACRT